MSDTARLVLVGVVVVFGVLGIAWAMWWPVKSKRDAIRIAPSHTIINNYVVHDFFVEHNLDTLISVDVEEFFDAVHIDDTLSEYVVSVVTTHNWVGFPEFVTRFRTFQGDVIEKSWRPAKGRLFGEAVGLFIVPVGFEIAFTEVRDSGRIPRRNHAQA